MTSSVLQQITDDLKTAMKARDDKLRVATLRLVTAAVKNRDIAARAEDRCGGLEDKEVLAVLTKMGVVGRTLRRDAALARIAKRRAMLGRFGQAEAPPSPIRGTGG